MESIKLRLNELNNIVRESRNKISTKIKNVILSKLESRKILFGK